MKMLFALSMLLLFVSAPASFLLAQGSRACCAPTATAEFAALGDDPAFVLAHLAPLPFQKEPGPGKMISVPTKGGKKANIFEVKAPQPTNNVLLVFHEYWGLNDYIKREAERLQKELGNVTVYAVDLYDGKVTDDPKKAASLTQQVKEDRAREIIAAAIAHAGRKAKIASIGWCFGGGWSLQSALMAGKQNVGCVMYYGMPEKSVDRLKTLNGDVLGIFGTQDKWITPGVVDTFKTAMKEAGKNLQVKTYDAGHAFANPSNPKFNKEATADAHEAAIDFLKKHFGEAKG